MRRYAPFSKGTSPDCQRASRAKASRSSGYSAAAPPQELLDLLFHIAEMGALPEDALAAGADGERRGVLGDPGRNQVLRPLARDGLERPVAGDAAGVRPDLVPELELVEDLDDLVLP